MANTNETSLETRNRLPIREFLNENEILIRVIKEKQKFVGETQTCADLAKILHANVVNLLAMADYQILCKGRPRKRMRPSLPVCIEKREENSSETNAAVVEAVAASQRVESKSNKPVNAVSGPVRKSRDRTRSVSFDEMLGSDNSMMMINDDGLSPIAKSRTPTLPETSTSTVSYQSRARSALSHIDKKTHEAKQDEIKATSATLSPSFASAAESAALSHDPLESLMHSENSMFNIVDDNLSPMKNSLNRSSLSAHSRETTPQKPRQQHKKNLSPIAEENTSPKT